LSIQNSSLEIAVIEPSGRLYGSEYCLLDIIDGLQRTQYSWHVFLPQGMGFDQILLDRGIDCELLLPRNLGELPIWQKSIVYGRILRRLHVLKPDLLYVNQAGSLRSAALYARWLKLPVVCQVQTLEDARWLSSRAQLHDVVQAFICNSLFIAEETSCDPQKKNVVYQGLPFERLEAAKNKGTQSSENAQQGFEEKETFVIGILGRVAVSKGHYLLIEAVKKLKDLLPTCRVVVIGEGLTPNDTQEYMETVINSGLASLFEFRGYRQAVSAELDRLDLLVIPSLAEPLGRVLFDAAEHGLPVILSDAGGLGEMSKRFDIGVQFKSGDAAALAERIVYAATNYADIRRDYLEKSLIMLARLSMQSYLSTIKHILHTAAARRVSSEVWLGDD